MTVLLLTAASILALFAAVDFKKWRSADLDFFVVVWIVLLAAWPSFSAYVDQRRARRPKHRRPRRRLPRHRHATLRRPRPGGPYSRDTP